MHKPKKLFKSLEWPPKRDILFRLLFEKKILLGHIKLRNETKSRTIAKLLLNSEDYFFVESINHRTS